MSEKRFVYHEEHFPLNVREIVDNEIGKTYDCEDAVNVLNELSEEKEYFERKKEYFLSKWSIVHAKNIQLRQEIKELKEDNEQLKKSEKINTDYAEQIVEENQKLRIAKNDLQREKEQLQKENEQLRKELDNFRPVMFQDMRKGTVILYTKKFGNNDEVSDGKDAIIQRLALENENLRKQVESSETTSNATSNYNAHLESKISTLEKENEQLRKIGVMYQGHNPCSNCTYCLENKLCCGINPPMLCDEMKKDYFIYGLCKKHRQIQKSIRRYDDE